MFFYPDAEPIGHCLTDVSPSYLTDGVFFNGGKIGPTHKCVAKQLSAIPRGPNDPVTQRPEVNPRTLENWTIDSKAWYVDNCGRNAQALHAMMGLLPKEKVDLYAGWKSKVALFPRSEQYEYCNIKEAAKSKKLRKNNKTWDQDSDKCSAAELGTINERPMPTPAFSKYKETYPVIRSEDGIPKRGMSVQDRDKSASANNEDRELCRTATDCRKRSEKNERFLASLETADPVKVGVAVEGAHPKDVENCDCPRPFTQHAAENEEDSKSAELEDDPRWNSFHENADVWDVHPRTEVERKIAMLKLHRPYRHEINTWYRRNKPTQLLPRIISEGKRPIEDSHFSNLI